MQDRTVRDRTWNVISQRPAARSRTKFLAAVALLSLVATFASLPARAGNKKCQIGKVADLPITMNSLRPLIPAKINGQEAKFILDSGAFYSMISSAVAAEYKLKLSPGPSGLTVKGIGGSTEVQVATVKDFNLVGVDIKNIEFLVGGSDIGSAGILGQNLLEKFDVEYDLANGVIRLFKSENCEGTVMAYWRTPGQAFSVMDIDAFDPIHAHTIGRALLNGQKIRVTSWRTTIMSLHSSKTSYRPTFRARKSNYSRSNGPLRLRISTRWITWRRRRPTYASGWRRSMRASTAYPQPSSNTDFGSNHIRMIRAWCALCRGAVSSAHYRIKSWVPP